MISSISTKFGNHVIVISSDCRLAPKRKITLAGLQSFLKERIMDLISAAAGSSVWQIRYVSSMPYFFLREIQHVSKTNLQVIKLLEVDDQKHDPKHDPKRVFLSEEKDDNIIGSIISKVNIIYVAPNVSDAFILSS